MKLVTQADAKGCGLACVAMVTGRTYEAVRSKSVGCWRKSYGMNGRMLQTLLDRFGRTALGVSTSFTRQTRVAVVKVNAELYVGGEREKWKKFQHYVVWCDGRVYDPGPGVVWKGNKEIDGMKLYLASVHHSARTGRWYWV